jgi:hypothetical protein
MSIGYKQIAREVEDQSSITLNGLADAQVGAYFIPLNTLDSSEDYTRQFVRVGGVLTLPTAKYQQRYKDLTMMPVNLQLGFGSYLFRPEVNYVWRKRKWGINTQLMLQLASENEMGFQLGNASMLNGSFFYNPTIGNGNLILNLGLGYEKWKQATEFGYRSTEDLAMTRTVLNSSIDVFLNQHVLGLQYTVPIQQENGEAQPDLKQVLGFRWSWFWN